MKRSELKVGDDLYYATPSDWKANRTGKKVTVVAVEAYKTIDRYNGGIDMVKTRDGKGNGVLVERPGDYRAVVVQVGHLRGPYEAVDAEVTARQDEATAARVLLRRQQQDARAIRQVLIDRAKTTGYGFALITGHGMDGRVSTTVETLGAMLDRIEALTTRVTELEAEINDLRDPAQGYMDAADGT